jgi:RNA polymerase sigma factor (sigma-70 family)
MLWRIAASYEGRPAQRQDLVQEIALALFHALPRLREAGALRAFVARVAHNRGVTHLVAQRRDGRVDDVDETIADGRPGPESQVAAAQARDRLAAAVRRLPLGLRQVVTLALEDFAHAEIAETLGITVNNVDVRLSRARERLRRELGA